MEADPKSLEYDIPYYDMYTGSRREISMREVSISGIKAIYVCICIHYELYIYMYISIYIYICVYVDM